MQFTHDLDAMMSMVGTLRDTLPLHILPEDDRRELARGIRVRRFRADEVVYHRGDLAADAHVVFTGLVKVMLLNDDGHEALVGLYGRGELFGELALFLNAPRESTVISVLPSTILQLSRDSCRRVLDRNGKARDWLFLHLATRLRALEDKYECLAFLDVPARLAKYLLELDHVGGDLPITQEDLAAAIGSSRVTVNKLLADFHRRGLIHADRRAVQILDRDALVRETLR